MDQKLLAVLNTPEDELGKGSPIALEVVQDDEMMCQAIAEELSLIHISEPTRP